MHAMRSGCTNASSFSGGARNRGLQEPLLVPMSLPHSRSI
jgi:hypothetical protein